MKTRLSGLGLTILAVLLSYACQSSEVDFEPIRLNFGGFDVFQADGKTFSGAATLPGWREGVIDQVFGVNDEQIYKTYVEGSISVQQALPNGRYALTLHFAEPLDEAKVGDRVFAVVVEGLTRLADLDIALFRDGRAKSALTVTFPVTILQI